MKYILGETISLTGIAIVLMTGIPLIRRSLSTYGATLVLALLAVLPLYAQSWLASQAHLAASILSLTCGAGLSLAMNLRHGDGQPQPIPLTPILLLPLLLITVDVLANDYVSLGEMIARMAPVALLLAVALATSAAQLRLRDWLHAVGFGFGVACLSTAFSPAPWRECSVFKCGPFDQLLAGPFASENYFGAAAAIALLSALALMGTRPYTAIMLATSSSLVIYASGSRTSQAALLFALLVWFISAARLATPPRLTAAVSGFAAMTMVYGTWLVYNSDLSDYSNRGLIWHFGTTALGDNWLLGKGISSWTPEVLSRNYMHSQSLFLLYSGGLAAMALMLWFVSAVRFAPREYGIRGNQYVMAAIAFLLVRGLTEVAWNPVAVDGTLFFALPILFGLTRSRFFRQLDRHTSGESSLATPSVSWQ